MFNGCKHGLAAESIRAARELLKYDILFLEEPIDPNYEGHKIHAERWQLQENPT